MEHSCKSLEVSLLKPINLLAAQQICLSSRHRSKKDLNSTVKQWLGVNAGGAVASVLEAAAHDVL